MFDVSGLTEVKMRKYKGWQGSYFVNGDDTCIAKTCSKCKDVVIAREFASASGKYNLHSVCRVCDSQEVQREISALKYGARTTEQIEQDRDRLRPFGHKRCSGCKDDLPLTDFTVNKMAADGLSGKCRGCRKAERASKDQKEFREYNKLASRKHYNKNRDRSDEQIVLDRDRVRPGGVKECGKCRVSKSFDEFTVLRIVTDGLHSYCRPCEYRQNVVRREAKYVSYWSANNIPIECYVCGDPWAHADHVIADSQDGSDDLPNRLPICASCNSSKYFYDLDEWLYRVRPDIADEVLRKVTVTYGIPIRLAL